MSKNVLDAEEYRGLRAEMRRLFAKTGSDNVVL